MRKGINPAKNDNELQLKSYHRIIVPIYIPNFEGYFKDSLEILKLCIDSLLLTIHKSSRITLYNNASHPKVKEYIDDLYIKYPSIDQIFHSKENMGKINAILAAAKGNLEPLITITDSDVLFKSGWQKETEKIFLEFPEAGMVSPVPSSKALTNFTANNWAYSISKGSLKFERVIDSDAMHRFDLSLGNKKLIYSNAHLKEYLVLKNKRNQSKAVMGCGHFVATMHRDVFDKGSTSPAFIKIVGGVENKFIDIPNQNLGFLRLATKQNFAYHMGNKAEAWMHEEFSEIGKNQDDPDQTINFSRTSMNKRSTFIGKVYLKLIRKTFIKNYLFKKFGLTNPDEYSI